jgi:hypothetical protein
MRHALIVFKSFCLLALLAGCVPLPAVAPGADPNRTQLSPTPIPLTSRTSLPDEVTAIMTAGAPRTYATYPSPDGQWRIEIVIHDCVQMQIEDETETKAYEELKLIHTRDGLEMVVQDQLRYCGGLGAFGLDGLTWSADSRYFFFTDAREGQPDGAPPGAEPWKRPIFRLDVGQQRVEPFE